jgi:hypothetical protein
MCAEAQIAPSVVEAVMVYVVNEQSFGGIGYNAVHRKNYTVSVKRLSVPVATCLDSTPSVPV